MQPHPGSACICIHVIHLGILPNVVYHLLARHGGDFMLAIAQTLYSLQMAILGPT